MAAYDYVAESPSFGRITGRVEATSEQAARGQLRARGLSVVELKQALPIEPVGALTDEQAAVLTDAVGTAAAARVPLDVTLAALAEERDDPQLAKVAQHLADLLQQGKTIDAAVASTGGALPPEVRGMLHAGAQCGDLAGTVEQFARERMAAQRIRRRIRLAIAYPLIILAILVPLALFLSAYVIPMFRDLFEEFDLELPTLTLLVLDASERMPEFIIGMLIVALAMPLLLPSLAGRWMLHRVRSATPVMGQLWTWSGQREFAALLASFLDLRLPMTSAVELTGDSLHDRNMARACTRLVERLQTGQPLSACMSQSIHFDRALVALVHWGERHGVLPEALRIASEVFDDRIDQRTTLLRRLLPPVTLVVVAAVAFTVVIGLMIPLVNLIEGLSM
jgi:type II secretory pathway component PulF